ncbi:unnamed protein product [Arctia plantaginis]|uniref:Kazal-like domain-containing protein n=1 Tax=Arctia plantaginis TaxID=874455 RepID=A0A8S1B503_ARCPL|nr:unnamed protein product [Arctia plantaginis]
MLLCLKIAIVALLSGIAVEGYGLRYSHRRRGSHDRKHFQLESLGRNGPRRDYGSNGKHGHFHFYRHPYYRRTTFLEELRRQWSYSEESSESDSGYSSEINEFDSPENSDWYLPKRHPSRLWRYRISTQDKNQEHQTSWTRPPCSRKTTQELPITPHTEKWNSIHMLESSPQSEAVTTPMSIPDVTMPFKTEFIMSRLAPIEEVSFFLTTATPETSQNTMSSPEISLTTMDSPEISPTTMSSPETTTVSQAVIDCIDNCISTPEFNPVCGTNDETYDNIGKLFCAKSCGIDVELRRMSRCWPLLPFADDYDDDEDNDNSTDRDVDRRGNIGNEGSGNDYGDESDNRSERLPPSSDDPSPPPHFEQSPPHFNIPIPLRNNPSSSLDDEPSPSPGGEPLNSLSSDSSLSLFSDLSPSPRAKSLSSDDKMSPPLGGNSNVVVTTGSVNFVSSSTTPSAPRFRRTTHLSDLQKCMKLCPVTTAYYPICGTDLVTYINNDRIECARRCGLEVQILCEQPCHLCNVGRQTLASSTMTSLLTTTPPTTPLTVHAATTRRNIVNAAPMTLIEQCVKSCPVTPEYNPVCGTNNVNYMNPVHLLCVQMCGDDVKIARFGPCPSENRMETPTVTTEQDVEEVTLSQEVIECTKRCISTSEYNPVCGTNEETYTNPGKLECAKFCGIDVKLSYKGFCNGFFFSDFTFANPAGERAMGGQATAFREILQPTSLSTGLPLRTSTLTSFETIPTTTPNQSTKSTTPWFLPLVYSPPPSSTFANTPSTTASTPITTTSESLNSTSLTLAPDVLISIFGNASLKTTIDITTKENKVRIDPRFGNEDDNVPFKRPCEDMSPECLKNSLQAALPLFANGDQDLGLEALDPYILEELNLTLSGITIHFSKGYAKGLKSCIVDFARYVDNTLETQVHCNLTILGNYRSSGSLLVFPINDNLKIHSILKFGSKVINGRTYLDVKSGVVKHAYDGRVTYAMTNLFKGSPEMSQAVLDFMNSNWKLVAEEFGTPLVEYGVKSIMKNVRRFLEVISLEELKQL